MVCALWVANGGVEEVAAVEQALGAGEIGDVGRDLAGEDGIVGQPQLLRPLHLAVPVRSLDQSDHDLARGAAGEIGEPVDHVHRTLLVGLHRQAQPVPAGQALVAGQGLEEVERGFQPLALLGVDRELDVPLAGDLRQLDDPRQQLGLELPPAAVLVARVQGRELDRQAGTVVQHRAGSTGRDPLQRILVGAEVAQGVGCRLRPLAQHVVGVAVAQLLALSRALDRLLDRLPEHELLAQDAHGLAHRLADHGLAQARDKAAQAVGDLLARLVPAHHGAGEHEAEGRGVDQEALRAGDPALPVHVLDLVPDQEVLGQGIGNAQQGLGQAHEHDALVRAEAVGVHEGLDPALAHGLGTQAVGQAPGPGLDPLGRDGVEPQLAQQRLDRLRLVLLVGRGDAVAQRVAVMRRKVGEEGGRHGWASVVGQIAECGTAAASCKVPRQPSRNPILAVLSRSP